MSTENGQKPRTKKAATSWPEWRSGHPPRKKGDTCSEDVLIVMRGSPQYDVAKWYRDEDSISAEDREGYWWDIPFDVLGGMPLPPGPQTVSRFVPV